MRMRRRRRAFILIASLMLSVLFLVTGLGVMSAQVSRYEASARIAEGIQAKNAALSGLDDVRVKLAKDVRFPPRKSRERDQSKFSYSETLVDTDPARPVSYSVVVDYSQEQECQVPGTSVPYRWIPYRWGAYKITVSGYVGPRAEPIAQSLLYAEYDIGTGSLIRLEDRSSL